jgi:hypothetical protein
MTFSSAQTHLAKGFLEGVVGRIEAAVDEAYRRVQASGREAFKQTLAKDYEFWSKCEGRWGAGPGYRVDISKYTEQEFDRDFLKAVQALIVGLLESEWDSIVTLMESLLKEQVPAEAVA